MLILGYFLIFLMGITLGLIGAGGSILTVPLLTSFFGLSPETAISYSLYVVGATPALAAILHFRSRSIESRVVIIFSLLSFPTVFVVRGWIFPRIPEQIHFAFMGLSDVHMSRPSFLMLAFSLLMMIASRSMIQKAPQKKERTRIAPAESFMRIALSAAVVGLLTGIFGAGGGFIMIPIFVNVLHLEMKRAVGTSLTLIALNSFVGIISEASYKTLDFKFLTTIVIASLLGLLISKTWAPKLQESHLRKSFGFFVLILGFILFIKTGLASWRA